ncbi:MAPK regulated corepressor interacting protein 2 isoform X4 [Phodopus roborovskii]|uniref:MAPK regulated corepressor interacting protein 2 isoform X4 n=1 Tax=Phodopus roborovskii TaxID=109678 RepID=UPI0021E4D2DA|nr:MAPK regulated corepressor interacting protein 2 isoform X4 [Phodopus roborovskii]
MPAARAADRSSRARAALGTLSGTLAPGKCPSHLRRNPERRGPPEPRKASRPTGTASAWRSGRCSPGLRLPPPTVAWQQVERQLDGGPADESGPRPVQYVESTPDPRLQNFVPIDLDEWWAQQFLAKITNCS